MAFDRDAITVINPANIPKLQVASKRSRFARYALHQAAVTTNGVDVIVEQRVARPVIARGQPFAGDPHTDTVRDALPQRTRCRLHTGSPAIFGVPCTTALMLPEALDVIQRNGRLSQNFVVG